MFTSNVVRRRIGVAQDGLSRVQNRLAAPWHLYLLGVVASLIGVLWAVGFRGFQVDDTGIYGRVIHHWLSSGKATFNTLDPAFPITSYLWFLVNAYVIHWFHVEAIYAFLRIASAIFYFASWVVFFLALRRFIRSPYILVGTALLLITDEIALESASSGMDTALALFASVLAIYLFETKGEGLSLGFALVTRPEGLFLALADGLTRLVHKQWRRIGWSLLGGAIVVACVFFLVERMAVSSTNTLQMKSSHFSLFLSGLTNLKRTLLIVGAFTGWPIVLLLMTGGKRLRKLVAQLWREPVIQMSVLFVGMTCGSYVALLNGDSLKARYFVVIVPFVYLILGIIADRTFGHLPRKARYWTLVWLVNLALILTAGLANARENYDTYLRRLQEAHLLEKHAQPGDTVFTGAIGVVGYETDLQVLDPAGLATPAAIKPIHPGDCDYMLQLYQPKFLTQLLPVATFAPVQTVAWADCHLDFKVQLVESVDMNLFEGSWFFWQPATATRVALYRITGWTPLK